MIENYLSTKKNFQIAEFYHRSEQIVKMFESLRNNPDGDQVSKLCMMVQFFGFNHLNMFQVENIEGQNILLDLLIQYEKIEE